MKPSFARLAIAGALWSCFGAPPAAGQTYFPPTPENVTIVQSKTEAGGFLTYQEGPGSRAASGREIAYKSCCRQTFARRPRVSVPSPAMFVYQRALLRIWASI